MRELQPSVVVSIEMAMDVCRLPFLDRFEACVKFYLLHFELNEALLTHARDRNHLRLYEELFAGSHMINIIACEGSDLVVQPESLPKLQRRFTKAGFRPLPVDMALTDEVSQLVGRKHRLSSLFLEQGAITLAWKAVPCIHATLWKPWHLLSRT